jgi:hypothetical protein
MAATSTAPIAVGLVVGILLFVALTAFLVRESRRPVHWHTAPLPVSARVSHARVAVVCTLFTVWSLWATARPVSGWR